MAYPALAAGMARLVGAPLPARVVRAHNRLIAAFVRRLGRSKTGLLETYPHEAYPTDVAAVAGAIALHGRVTGRDYSSVLTRWAHAVARLQIHPPSGFVYQRMNAKTGAPRVAPRGSGTALAAYFAGFQMATSGIASRRASSPTNRPSSVSARSASTPTASQATATSTAGR